MDTLEDWSLHHHPKGYLIDGKVGFQTIRWLIRSIDLHEKVVTCADGPDDPKPNTFALGTMKPYDGDEY